MQLDHYELELFTTLGADVQMYNNKKLPVVLLVVYSCRTFYWSKFVVAFQGLNGLFQSL